MTAVCHRYVTVERRRLFYQEAGIASDPALLLLHGFPSSSFIFRNLIPELADRYHVIAPDLLGCGLSDSPPVEEFHYTFDALARLTAGLLEHLSVKEYVLYVQGFGAPVGWRLALANPESVQAIISQGGNGYEAGFEQAFWKAVRRYWDDQNPQTEAAVRQNLTLDGIRWQYLHGVSNPTVVSPETWHHDYSLVSRNGSDRVHLQLLVDYASDLSLYPELHAYLRESEVPVLAVWGRNDKIFGPAGARAFLDDSPHAEIRLIDGGHCLLETHLELTVHYIRSFLDRVL